MAKKKLVHKDHVIHEGKAYQILVYKSTSGRLFAETPLGIDDIIINDGASLEDVLEKHNNILPLAITSRKIRKDRHWESVGNDP
ncbi:MAG TPA: hypothetical protein VGJ93_00925 [Desulfuromonadaceae bacterium]|jgi:hypothetical protein